MVTYATKKARGVTIVMLLSLLLLQQSLFLTLHLSLPASSFPKPLSAAEEADCLERWAAGDMAARNTLVEHNLRLVAHIIKKY